MTKPFQNSSIPNFSFESVPYEYEEYNMVMEAFSLYFDEWEFNLNRDRETKRMILTASRIIADRDQINDIRKIAHDRVTRTGWAHYNHPATIWDSIKLHWLKPFREHCGLTAPFWQPNYAHVSIPYQYITEFNDIYEYKVTKHVCAPGTRSVRVAVTRPKLEPLPEFDNRNRSNRRQAEQTEP